MPFTPAILAYAGFVTLSLLWSTHLDTAITNVKNNGHLLLIPILALTLTPQKIESALKAFGAGLLISIAAGYLGLFIILPKGEGAVLKEPVYFMNRLDYVFILSITAIYGLNRVLYKKKFDKELVLLVLASGASLITIFLLQARIAYLMLAAGLILTPLLRFQGKKRVIFTLAITALFALTTAGIYTFNDAFRKRIHKTIYSISLLQEGHVRQYSTSWGLRVMAIKSGIEIWKQSPLVGQGAGDNIHALRAYLKEKASQDATYQYTYKKARAVLDNHFHNQYIETLTQTGLVGLALLLWMFFSFWRERPKESSWNSFASIFLAMIFLGFIAEPYIQKQFPSAMIAFVTGLLLAQKKSETTP